MTPYPYNRLIIIVLSIAGSSLFAQNAPTYDPPSWAEGIVWYQIFPERFHDGDTSNQPDGSRIDVPENWGISQWTMDWYARDAWERQMSSDFYGSVRKRRFGGDLQGVINKLDYLKELGIGGIYFNPLFDAPSEHKYDAAYYHHIDRNFGPDPSGDEALMAQENPADPETWQWTSADSLFLLLIQEVHKRDMKIIIDGVWNHTGTHFWAFEHLKEQQEESPYKNWYIVNQFDDPASPDTNEFDYEGWWGYKGLPVFREVDQNLMPGLKEHIFAATERWMDPNGDGDPSDGVDGWRLDVAEEVGINFWLDWHRQARKINPKSITVAEIWTDKAKHYIKPGLFSSVMNYRFAAVCQDYFIDGSTSVDSFVQELLQIQKDYPKGAQHVLQNLMDSHDVPRLASMCVNPGREYDRKAHPRDGFRVRKPNTRERKIQKLIALFQFTWPGAPMIYYGTESGMWGADDPDDRKPMVWPEFNFTPETHHPYGKPRPVDSNQFDQDLHQYYQTLALLKKDHAALRQGSVEIVQADPEEAAFIFKRILQDETIWVLLNNSKQDWALVDMSKYTSKKSFEDVFSGAVVVSTKIGIPTLSGLILKE